MRKHRAFFFVLILFLTGFTIIDRPRIDRAAFEAFADSLYNGNVEAGKIAGGAVVVVKNNKLLLDKSYGYASLELSVPMPHHASFEIGSVTKQFTAAAILRLADQGKLSLRDDFTKYIPYNTNGRTVTIGQLLNHTSGIPGYTEMPEVQNLTKLSFDRDTLVRIIEKKDFLFEPGEALIYNNSAYFLLGLIIIKTSGTSYINYLTEQFFEPLGMVNTYYCTNTEVVRNKAYGYTFAPSGIEQREYLDHIWPFAAGSLCSTTEDLLKWMKALHQGRVFGRSQYQLMITPQKLNDGSDLRYAMGITNYESGTHRMIGHGGAINGFLAETRYFPDDDLYIICLQNTTGPNGATFFANQLTWRLLTKQEERVQKLDMALEPLGGTYAGQARGRLLSVDISVAGNRLVMKTAGRNDVDTLKAYLGKGTWSRGNDRIIFKNGQMHLDNVIGHFVLSRKN